jgi:hypothetical protein
MLCVFIFYVSVFSELKAVNYQIGLVIHGIFCHRGKRLKCGDGQGITSISEVTVNMLHDHDVQNFEFLN